MKELSARPVLSFCPPSRKQSEPSTAAVRQNGGGYLNRASTVLPQMLCDTRPIKDQLDAPTPP